VGETEDGERDGVTFWTDFAELEIDQREREAPFAN
jgi:hypothetical protein